MKNRKKVKKSRGMVKNIILAVLGVAIVFIIFLMLGLICEWLVQDNGRYILGIIILGYILIRLFKKEFDL